MLSVDQKKELEIIYKDYDDEQLLKEGKELLQNNAVLSAAKWDSRFWQVAKLIIIGAVLMILATYGYVFYKTYTFGKQYQANQQIQIQKALGEPNENKE
jgi:hypothetical protein